MFKAQLQVQLWSVIVAVNELLNIGRILINGRPITERTFSRVCAYVSFKQQLHECLTVRETLLYQAKLALSNALSFREKQERVRGCLLYRDDVRSVGKRPSARLRAR